ncbi:RNA methyltransferase [Propionivibrio dicarboxylicus]|uniref:23S rRNA (Adenine2503-C2)-methyltransferase n=1 Tax=Propionivibrio dicarboxylicus TaxID=83767 RepID=A0A1G8MAF4_9RHOO|nr:RNA methyltransferase [Propionivibrio dicarboxylicus]SDI64929.1 23S rRNA (adenine2503-C2)-methyltransferase [Propionivibrio dicarboxylicus]
MRIEFLRERLESLGAKPGHVRRILAAWLAARPLDAGARRQPAEHCLPRALREALPALAHEWANLACLRSRHPGGDGSARLLVGLADGQTVESVLLPRDGVCISTQVGCAVGCAFCMTGKSGLLRQLGSAEIVAQLVLARSLRPVKKVVFMGMGEPAHNLDAVLEAIALMGSEGGIAHKNLVLSTVGDRRVFDRLPHAPVKPALALSLHTTDPALRRQLLPKAPAIEPAELVALGEDYARACGYPIQYQWTLLAGVNDGDADIDRIADWLEGKYAMMNFIPFNPVDGSPFRRPSPERLVEVVARLRRRRIVACLRDSAGQDVDGGCGQLRARSLADGAA